MQARERAAYEAGLREGRREGVHQGVQQEEIRERGRHQAAALGEHHAAAAAAPLLNAPMHAGEPQLVQFRGHQIAIEIQNNGRQQIRQIPVYMVTATILAGAIDNPEILFGAGLQAAYADVLALANRAANAEDFVRMGVHLDGLKSNHGAFYTLNLRIRGDDDTTALHQFVIAWEEVQQSDDQLHLNDGGLELKFTFTLAGDHHPPVEHVGHRTKKTMYCRQIYDDYYTKTDALKRTPVTPDQQCWPMAFLSCQLRRIHLDETKQKVIQLEETKRESNLVPSTLHRSIELENFEDRLLFTQHAPHFVDPLNPALILFHPFKKIKQRVNNVYEYFLNDAETVGELNAWVRAAEILHTYVEQQLERAVNKNNLVEVGQAYADVFEVYIHVLRVECQLEETNLFCPAVTLQDTIMDHIYIVLGDNQGNSEHAHAVTNRRKMMYRLQRVNVMGLHNYCDFCKHVTENKNVNVEEGLKHISECRKKFIIESQHGQQVFNTKQYYSTLSKTSRKYLFFPTRKQIDKYTCSLCGDVSILKDQLRNHLCRIPLPLQIPERRIIELQPPFTTTPNLWVFDMESSQRRCLDITAHIQYVHTPNCICLRPVYSNLPHQRYHFPTTDTFCEFLLSDKQMEGATLFSHNGGSYDDQFIIQYLERNCLPHTVLPRPSSTHKYLEVIIPRGEDKAQNITLKDFIVFVPYSLKEIARSFGLVLQKGDFPHRFNDGEHDEYIGSLPPLDIYEPNHFYQASDRVELEEWHREQSLVYCTCSSDEPCTCNKQKWNFQVEIQKYCWLDVDILADAICKFRTQHIEFGQDLAGDRPEDWQPTPIDPLLYSTQAQAAIHFFLQGHGASTSKIRAAVSQKRVRSGFSQVSILWLESIAQQSNINIHHAGNHVKEYFDAKATFSCVDGYCVETNHVYEFLGCFWHGCPSCHGDKLQSYSAIHPVRNIPWKTLYENTIEKIEKLQEVYDVTTIWECEYMRQRGTAITNYEKELMNLIVDREMFYGGRTEVFSAYAKSTPTDRIEHHDVTSMYPFVCATKLLPIGHPTIYFGASCQLDRLRADHSNPYFGYVHCFVVPRAHCVLGLLPQKQEGKLQFDVIPKAGVWFTEEIYLAQSQGYVVTELYEVLHFDAQNRSDTYFRGYMEFFLRIKQEAEGWKKAGASSESPSIEEQQRVIDNLYIQNGNMGRMRPERVRKDPVKRALAKLNLNCLWGKFAQQDTDRTNSKIVYSYDSWVKDVYKNVAVDQSSIRYREMIGGAYTCYYKTTHEHEHENKYVNIWIASAVTAWARCILHRQMILVNPERVLYCDTDSIVFLYSRVNEIEYTGRGLGKWTSEVETDDEILEFMGLAPKTYMKVERHCLTGHIKAKGVRMTLSNQFKTTPELVRTLLQEEFIEKPPDDDRITLSLDHMTIFANSVDSKYPYATVFTRYAQKILRIVLSKRQKVPFPHSHASSLVRGDIERLYLHPFSNEDIREHPSYQHVYSRYEI